MCLIVARGSNQTRGESRVKLFHKTAKNVTPPPPRTLRFNTEEYVENQPMLELTVYRNVNIPRNRKVFYCVCDSFLSNRFLQVRENAFF